MKSASVTLLEDYSHMARKGGLVGVGRWWFSGGFAETEIVHGIFLKAEATHAGPTTKAQDKNKN